MSGVALTDTAFFVCRRCSKRLRMLIVCKAPICPRCTGKCEIQNTTSRTMTHNEREIENILGRAAAHGVFQLPRKKEQNDEAHGQGQSAIQA